MGWSDDLGIRKGRTKQCQLNRPGRPSNEGLLNRMNGTTEQIAIWILEALKSEWERTPTLIDCRAQKFVLGELKSKYQLEDADITRGLRFLISIGAIDSARRQDEQATLPSITGLEFLKTHQCAQKKEVEREQDVRLRIYPIIIAILSAIIALLGYLVWK